MAVLCDPNPSQSNEVKATEAAADDVGLKVQAVEVKDVKDFNSAYTAIKGQAGDAIIIVQSSFSFGVPQTARRACVADLADNDVIEKFHPEAEESSRSESRFSR